LGKYKSQAENLHLYNHFWTLLIYYLKAENCNYFLRLAKRVDPHRSQSKISRKNKEENTRRSPLFKKDVCEVSQKDKNKSGFIRIWTDKWSFPTLLKGFQIIYQSVKLKWEK